MEPYSISCTTCSAKLKVRSEEAIGQILSCPKCGSMVEVMPPTGNEAPLSDSNLDSATTLAMPAAQVPKPLPSKPRPEEPAPTQPAPTQAAPPTEADVPLGASFEDVESLLDDQPPVSKDSAGWADTAGSISHVAGLSGEVVAPPEIEPQAPPQAHPEDHPEPDAAVAATPLPTPPPTEWSSPGQQSVRKLAMIGVAATGAVIAVIALWGYLASRNDAANPPVAEAKQDDPPEVKPEEPASPTDEPKQEPPAEEEKKEPTETVEVPPGVPEPVDPGPNEEEEVVVAKVPQDPFPIPVAPPEAPPLTEPFPKQFGPIFDPEPVEEFPPEEPNVEPSTKIASERSPREVPPLVNVATHMEDRIPAIRFQNTPLLDAVRLLSQMSTIPITVDSEVLAWSKLSTETKLNLSKQDTTVGQLLEEILAAYRVGYRIEKGEILVGTSSADAKLLTLPFPISKVASGVEDQKALLAAVTTLVAPETWKASGGVGTAELKGGALAVSQTPETTYRVLVFFEKLSLARGKEPLAKKFPRELFAPSTRREKATPILHRNASVTYYHPAPLVDILHELERQTQTRILIDWHGLRAANWSMKVEGTLTVEGMPLNEALDSLLAPLDLTWRAVDARTIQVTSQIAADAARELEFYPVKKLAPNDSEGAELLTRLNEEFSPSDDELFWIDPQSNTLVARLCQTRHVELGKLLALWGK